MYYFKHIFVGLIVIVKLLTVYFVYFRLYIYYTLLFIGMTAAVDECWGGYYCPAGQSSPNPTEYICPQGMHCPNGSATYQVRFFLFQFYQF